MKLTSAMGRIGTETAFEVLVRARQLEARGRDIIHLEIGEPDFATPVHIREAAKAALDEGWTHYGPSQGLPELREAIASYVSRSRGIQVDAGRVCVVPGGKPVIFFSMLALLEPGDEVIYPNPSFPIYESMIEYCGATPVPVPLLEARGFAFDLDFFRSRLSDRTKMIILNSPANPTGGVLSREDLRTIAGWVRDRDVVVLSDEIYSRICYETEPASIASEPGMLDKTIILDGFSKTYAMTGWRIGYGVLPPFLVDAVNRLMVNSNSCTASFTQRAAIAALCGDQTPVDRMVAEFRRRRDAFVEELNRMPGVRCPLPEGAFYAFANIEQTGWGSRPLADALLNEAGVACLSGTAFGRYGEGYLRFSYANSLENLKEAARRMRHFLEHNTKKDEEKRIVTG
ncbi:MAG: pyridoxal phosphate-dependent aminotransferase [Acidobacteriota bacterium]